MFDLPQITVPGTFFETTLAVLIFLAVWQFVLVIRSLASWIRGRLTAK